MKFKVLPIVHGFRYKERRYKPGEIVDLPPEEAPPFLESVKDEEVVEAPVQEKTPEVNLDISVAPKAHLSASIEELETPPEVKTRAKRVRTDA